MYIVLFLEYTLIFRHKQQLNTLAFFGMFEDLDLIMQPRLKSLQQMFVLCTCLLLFNFIHVSASTSNSELYSKWTNNSLPDSTRLGAVQELSRNLLYSDTDSSRNLAEAQLDFAINSKNIQSQIEAHTTIGGTYWVELKYIDALNHYLTSLELAKKIKNKHLTANAHNNIGTVYDELGDYPKALDQYEKSLTIKLELNDKAGLATTYTNIGAIYNLEGKNAQALEYFNKGLALDKELKNSSGIAQSYNNLGMVYSKIGEHGKAKSYYEQSLTIEQELNDQRGIANALNNLGNLYVRMNKTNEALNYFKQCLKIQEETADKLGMAVSQTNIGNIYIDSRKYNDAIKWCEKSYSISEKQKLLQQQEMACECLYLAHKRKKNEDYALAYLERLLTIKDQLKVDETSQMLQQLEFTKELQIQQINFKNKQESDSLKKEEERLKLELAHKEEVKRNKKVRDIALISGIIIMLIAGGLFMQLRIVRRSRKLIQKEKNRSDELLLNILPEEIAQELKEKGHADAKNHEKVTILFTDFKEFTQTSEKLSAHELVEEINACFQTFDRIMEQYDIEKIKTIGDAYMAAGGLPVPESGSVEHTVCAAIDMQAFITNRKTEAGQEGKIAFEMRVGIHTGSAVAGIVGVKKFQYDIWGDTVNTAARMESSGEVGQVNISESTYQVIKDNPKFRFTPRGKIEAKHKGAIEMYFVDYSDDFKNNQ